MVEEDKGDKSSGNISDSEDSDIWVMSEKFFEILRVLGFFFLVVTFCQFWSMSEGNEMEKLSSCSSVSDICVIEAGERLRGVVDKVDVYSWNASIISSNDSPEDSSETGVDVANGLFL